jgi:hypothetical protein
LVGEARKDRYGFFTDIAYTDIEDDDATPGPLYSDLNVRTKTWIFSAAGFYRMLYKGQAFLDFMAGFRYWSVDSSLAFGAGLLPAAESSNSKDWFDPLIGFKGLHPLGESKFYINGSLVAGGFKLGSTLMRDMMVIYGMSGFSSLEFSVQLVPSGHITGHISAFKCIEYQYIKFIVADFENYFSGFELLESASPVCRNGLLMNLILPILI